MKYEYMNMSRRWIAFVALVLCLGVMLFAATGCRQSDALKEIVYDQTATDIDYDNPTKFYISDSTADEKSDKVSAKETTDDESTVTDIVQNLVIYSSKPNTQGYTAKKSLFAKNPDFKGIEASEEVCFVYSTDKDAVDHALTVEEQTEKNNDDAENDSVSSKTSASQGAGRASGNNAKSSTKGDSGKQTNDGDGSTKGGEGKSTSPTESGKGGGNGNGKVKVAYDATDPTADPAKANRIAAYGSAATVVRMIGGKGALVAADAETIKAYKSVGLDGYEDIAKGWEGDGSDASKMDVEKIIKAQPDTILVYSSDYLKEGLSKSDANKLTKAGITQTVIYPMVASAYIKQDVTLVGEILAGSDSAQYASETKQRASDYRSLHDEVVNKAASKNGGLAGSVVYQTGKDSKAPGVAGGEATYTVLVDAYDASARYTGGAKGGWKPSDGLAFASAGYASTPVSYYMQAGGLVNNAAANSKKTAGGKLVLWQFHPNYFTFKAKQWSGDEVTESAKMPSDAEEYCGSLLSTPVEVDALIRFGNSFGSAAMPRLVVTSKEIEKSIIDNSKDPNGAYHPYDVDAGAKQMGPNGSVWSCLGLDWGVEDNVFTAGKLTDDDIVVNPTGLFSDWTEGTAESFLEAAWVNDVAKDNSIKVGWKSYVEKFYEEFYDIESLSSEDWKKINPEGD